MNKVELIDRYIYAVTQKLPQEQRKEIAEELRGLIEDMLDERVGSEYAKENDVEEVLLELGSPRKLADKYRGEKRYLIGPELFDTYAMVLKIVLIVIGSLITVGFVIQIIIDPTAILKHFVDMIVSFVIALPMTFAWITFGFAMGEYFGGSEQIDLLGKEWTPADLPLIPEGKKEIKRSESIIGILVYVIIIAFLVFSNEYLGIWLFNNGFTGVIPFLNEDMYQSYLLLIILVFGFGIIKECFKLVTKKWTYKLVSLTAILNAISIVAVLFILNGPAFWNPNFMDEIGEAGILTAGTNEFQTVATVWEQLTFWFFILLIVGLIWEVIDVLMKTRKNK